MTKRYALIVGIGAYEVLPKLAKPKNDAQALYALLKQHGNFDEIHLLTDEQATCEKLTQKLEYVLLEQGDKSEVLIYFSGHGFTAGASKYEQQGYLAAEENCLPLLEFALTELWEQRDKTKRELTAAAYTTMGGLAGALNKRATAVYETLRPVDQKWAKRICLQLVRIGRGERDTRQRQAKRVLLEMGDRGGERNEHTGQAIADVIDDLVKGRLLVTDSDLSAASVDEATGDRSETVGDKAVEKKETDSEALDSSGYVDLAHEALLEGWEQFAAWRQADRDQRRLVQRLEDAYDEWVTKWNRDERFLLSGGLLLELKEQWSGLAEILSEKRGTELEKFFAASDEREQQNVAVLEQALAKTRLQEASRKIRTKLDDTPAQTVEATVEAIGLVQESKQKFEQVIYPAQDAMHRAFSNIHERLKLSGHSSWVNSVAFSPKGDRIVSGSRDNTLRLWRGGGWEDCLRHCCTLLLHYTTLTSPQTEAARNACEACQQVWSRGQSAEFAVAQGSALARRGDIEGAVAKFERAKELDPALVLEPMKRATELAEWSR